jgi:hypothetical protein
MKTRATGVLLALAAALAAGFSFHSAATGVGAAAPDRAALRPRSGKSFATPGRATNGTPGATTS